MTTPAPDTRRTAEEMREFRKALALACNDPGHFVGYKGERSLGEWQVDALLSGPLAPILQEAAHLRAENANLRDRVRGAEGAGRGPSDTGSRPSDQAASHPAPAGFDPSRGGRAS